MPKKRIPTFFPSVCITVLGTYEHSVLTLNFLHVVMLRLKTQGVLVHFMGVRRRGHGNDFTGFPGNVSRAQDNGETHLDAKGQRGLTSCK